MTGNVDSGFRVQADHGGAGLLIGYGTSAVRCWVGREWLGRPVNSSLLRLRGVGEQQAVKQLGKPGDRDVAIVFVFGEVTCADTHVMCLGRMIRQKADLVG